MLFDVAAIINQSNGCNDSLSIVNASQCRLDIHVLQ